MCVCVWGGAIRRGSGLHLCRECMKDVQEKEGGGRGEEEEEEEWDV